MRALRDKKGHIYCLRSPPPPPPHTHTPKGCLYSLFIYWLCSLQIQHSFLCSFKWVSLLKLFPSIKRSYVPCSLIWSLLLSKSSICFVLSYLKKMSLFPKNALEEICQREINVTVILTFQGR